MDIIFDCPNCQQELAVDSAGAGTEIDCPACGETITIPRQSTKAAPEVARPDRSARQSHRRVRRGQGRKAPQSAGARQAERAADQKAADAPVEAVAKGADKKIRLHTIRHATCFESGHDRFDEKVTEFLNEVGEANLISVHTINYTYVDIGIAKDPDGFWRVDCLSGDELRIVPALTC